VLALAGLAAHAAALAAPALLAQEAAGVARYLIWIIEPGLVAGPVREPQLSPRQHAYGTSPDLDSAHRIRGPIHVERRLLDPGQLP